MKKKAINFQPHVDANIGGKYLLQEFIDEGSFGTVWKAINFDDDEVVALKIPKNQERGDNTLAEGKEFIGSCHKNVVRIKWMDRIDGLFVIEMEYFKGHKLSDELCESGFISPRTFDEIYNLFMQILEGVEYIHSKKICHGDIKPQNILTDGKIAKITDFGTSKLIEDLFIKTIDGGGTWAYMAPEVAGSNQRYLNSDIYALGVLLYKFLTGRTPHETANQLINNIPYPKPREINENISLEVENIILRLLERDPKLRYQSVGEIRKDLEASLNKENNILVQNNTFIKSSIDRDWLETVISLYKENNFTQAEMILKNEYDNGNSSEDIKYHIAYTYFRQNRLFHSLETIENININNVEEIRRESFKEDLVYLRAKVLFELKRYEESIRDLKWLNYKNNKNLDYRYKLACSYGLNNEQEKAIEILEEINKETPGMLYIIKKLGHAYDQIKEYKKARAFFNYALKLDHNDTIIRKRLDEYSRYLGYL